jgi:hypothetical protein
MLPLVLPLLLPLKSISAHPYTINGTLSILFPPTPETAPNSAFSLSKLAKVLMILNLLHSMLVYYTLKLTPQLILPMSTSNSAEMSY